MNSIVRDRQLRILFANCLRIPVKTHLDILIVCSFLYMKQKLVYSHDQYYKDETGSLDYYKKALYLWLYFYLRKRGFRYTYCILY